VGLGFGVLDFRKEGCHTTDPIPSHTTLLWRPGGCASAFPQPLCPRQSSIFPSSRRNLAVTNRVRARTGLKTGYGGHISGRASHTPFLESGQRPDQLRLLRQWVLEQASVTVAELSIGKLPQTTIMGQRRLSRPQLYRYFCHKLMQVRIFRDTSCSLFKELKLHVQVFMNRLAGLCNAIPRSSLILLSIIKHTHVKCLEGE